MPKKNVLSPLKKRKQARLEKKLSAAKEEEEKLLAELEAIQEEKERLIGMDQHEILAEAIMAIRGFYQEFIELKKQQDKLLSQIDSLESEVAALSVRSLNNALDTDD